MVYDTTRISYFDPVDNESQSKKYSESQKEGIVNRIKKKLRDSLKSRIFFLAHEKISSFCMSVNGLHNFQICLIATAMKLFCQPFYHAETFS